MRSRATTLILIAVLAGACLNSDTSDGITPQPGDTTIDDDYPEDEQEIRAARQAVARADLLLEVSGGGGAVHPGDVVDLVFHVTSLDSDFVNAPQVTISMPVGVSASDAPAGCEASSGTLTCLVGQSILSGSGQVPVSADPLEVAFQIAGDAASGRVVIDAFVESLDNPVDNDPNPGNNSVVVELDVG